MESDAVENVWGHGSAGVLKASKQAVLDQIKEGLIDLCSAARIQFSQAVAVHWHRRGVSVAKEETRLAFRTCIFHASINPVMT